MTNQRRIGLDIGRGLAILLVIVGHAAESLADGSSDLAAVAIAVWRAIYAFHMPLFFLLSGAADSLGGRRTLRQTCHAALGLVATASLLDLAVCASLAAFGRLPVAEVSLRAAYGQFFLAPLWFVAALAMTRVVDAFAGTASSPEVRWTLLGGIAAASYICALFDVRAWQVHTLFAAAPFYVAGRRLGGDVLRVSWWAAACGLAAVLYLSPTNPVHVASGLYGRVPTSIATALGGACFVLAVARALEGRALGAGIATIGRRSFGLFVVNGAILALAPSPAALAIGPLGSVVLAATGIAAQVVLAAPLDRPLRLLRARLERMIAAALAPPETASPATVRPTGRSTP